MNNIPKITFYVNREIDGQFQFIPMKSYTLEGSYPPGDTIILKLQIWNNRSGDEDVLDAKNARLVIAFKEYNDNFLLHLCKIKVGEKEPEPLIIDSTSGTYELGTISGRSNNGSIQNKDNYKEIDLYFGPIPSNIKSAFETLRINVEYDN